MEIKELAEILNNCSVDAYSHPLSRSRDEWNMYRENVAECLLNIFDIREKKESTRGSKVGTIDVKCCPECQQNHESGMNFCAFCGRQLWCY